MADLGRIFARAQAQVDEAVETAGTRVRIADVTVDTADNLEQNTTVANAREITALVTILGAGEAQVSPTFEIRNGDWRVLTKSSEALPHAGQDVRVMVCRDARLLERHGKILGTAEDSTGAYTFIYVRPAPRTRTP